MNWTGLAGLALLLASLAVVPGVGDFMVAGLALRRGFRSAVFATLGILAADLIIILAVVAGASLLPDLHSQLGSALRWCSATVLIGFSGWLLRSNASAPVTNLSGDPIHGYSFAIGFTVTFFDPKALAFYFGALPTMFDMATIGAGDILALVLMVSAVICMTKLLYVWLALRGTTILPSRWVRNLLLQAIGFALIAAGSWNLISMTQT